MERRPRMRTVTPPPGWLPDWMTSTPAARPCKAWRALVTGNSAISLDVTEEMAPVVWLFFWVP